MWSPGVTFVQILSKIMSNATKNKKTTSRGSVTHIALFSVVGILTLVLVANVLLAWGSMPSYVLGADDNESSTNIDESETYTDSKDDDGEHEDDEDEPRDSSDNDDDDRESSEDESDDDDGYDDEMYEDSSDDYYYYKMGVDDF